MQKNGANNLFDALLAREVNRAKAKAFSPT